MQFRPDWRVAGWAANVTLPMAGLALLLARPELDVVWEHHPSHFWLVVAGSAASLLLAAALVRAVRRRRDARLLLVSLVFQLTAGFLGVHAVATPGVLLTSSNAGFVAATPVGLVLGGIAALASSTEFTPAAAARLANRWWLYGCVPWLLLAVWLVLSLAQLPPLHQPGAAVESGGLLVLATAVGVPLYALAAVRYLRTYRQRRSPVLLSVLTAFVLLAEALVAVGFSRGWHASWWEWHLLMAAAFTLIVVSAHTEFRREGSLLGVFDSVTLHQTVAALERDYATALETMVDELTLRADGGVAPDAPLGAAGAGLARRFGLSDRQVAVLQQAGAALGRERRQVRRLDALVTIARRASVIKGEDELLADAVTTARDAFDGDELRLGTLHAGRLTFDDGGPPGAGTVAALRELSPQLSPGGDRLTVPIAVKGTAAGVLEVARRTGRIGDADRALLATFAGQLGVVLENARLYGRLDGLFRSYMSPAVATALVADPDQAGLGGRISEVTVLMADLSGFTPFAERTAPDAVVAMLNAYYGAVVPVVLDEGGTVVQFVGDAVMALFNAPVRQPDHALRAARAGLRLHRAVEGAARPGWPRFRVGINTGPALVGNIGAAQMRNFTAIGDTTNTAARLQGIAEPGQVVVADSTRLLLGHRAHIRPRGPVAVTGRREPVTCFTLTALGSPSPSRRNSRTEPEDHP
jgi:class 3 adenylate cyclase